MTRSIRYAAVPCLALALAGCGGKPSRVVPHPVSGQVLYGGKAAEGVQVFFLPTSAPTVPAIPQNPHGTTGPDGRFTLKTYAPGDGAAEGGYQVILLWPPKSSGNEEESVDLLRGWYDAVHSRLSAQVKAGPNDLQPFRLPIVTGPPEALQGIPGRN